MNTKVILNNILKDIRSGNLNTLTIENCAIINNTTVNLLNLPDHTQDQVDIMGLIVVISNILYNNTNIEMLPLEDGVYDILLGLYKKYNPNYQVGAEPIRFEPVINNNIIETKQLKRCMKHVGDTEEFLFYEELSKTPKTTRFDYCRHLMFRDNTINRRSLNTPHEYPELVGTLDKCKFVLNVQAAERGVLDDTNVEIFERDFIQRDIEAGLIDPDREFYVVVELKSDGVSVAGEIAGDTLISATGRGDTNNNLATDLTPILQGYKFNRAKDISKDNVFGMKFEAVITYDNLCKLSQVKGRDYKNCRNAIIGIFASSDAYMYRDYITLIPLATSMEVDRLTEIEFMNRYYNVGEYLRYAVIKGNYKEVLFQVKKFVEEAEYMRGFLPYMYDGVVVSYIEPDLIDALGRKNSVNKYSVAIKFNALKKQTIFLGYTYTIGQNGVVTPMIHYNPVEFYGTIHDKSTGHSYKRTKELNLRLGDVISVEFVNDVMPYVTKPDLDDNALNPNEVINFITNCPSCNTLLEESDSGKSMVCNNINCPERNISRMVNMLQKLNLKDFSEETLKAIAKFSLTDLLALKLNDIKFLGAGNSQKFMERLQQLRETPVYDYKIIGALGFSSIAAEKWKLILNSVPIEAIINLNDFDLKTILLMIKGIGPMAADIICAEREFFYNDLITISKMPNVMKSMGVKSGKSIRYSGIRDKQLNEKLNSMGHDANDNAGVTKTTDILIVPYDGYTSSKTAKVGVETMIVAYEDFKNNIDKYL